jgi:hypothetical protein
MSEPSELEVSDAGRGAAGISGVKRARVAALSAGLSLLLLAGLYVFLKPSRAPSADTRTQPHVYRLSVDDAPQGTEPPLIKANQGDVLTLVFAAHRPGTLAIHGYEQEIALKPGGEVTLKLTADRAGRYPVHLHGADGSHTPVAALEVQPR